MPDTLPNAPEEPNSHRKHGDSLQCHFNSVVRISRAPGWRSFREIDNRHNSLHRPDKNLRRSAEVPAVDKGIGGSLARSDSPKRRLPTIVNRRLLSSARIFLYDSQSAWFVATNIGWMTLATISLIRVWPSRWKGRAVGWEVSVKW